MPHHQCKLIAPVPGPRDLSNLAIGKEWRKLQHGEVSRKYLNLVRVNAEKPCNAITASAGTQGAAGVMHPSEPRKFTIPELRRLCAFPDDFQLTGSFRQQWERLGRSVPPVMMFHVARAIRDQIFGELGLVHPGAREVACWVGA